MDSLFFLLCAVGVVQLVTGFRMAVFYAANRAERVGSAALCYGGVIWLSIAILEASVELSLETHRLLTIMALGLSFGGLALFVAGVRHRDPDAKQQSPRKRGTFE